MGPLDAVVLTAYLAGMLGLSAWLARSQRHDQDYYVGNRDLPWWALGLSSMATQSSANSFIGIPAFVALVPGGGLIWLQYELALPLALLLVMTVVMPVFRGGEFISIYEYLEHRFDRSTRQILSGVFLLSRGLATGVGLYAGAVVVEVFTGWNTVMCVLLMGGATVAYDLLGGMRAVVWSDVLQMGVLLAGAVICLHVATDLSGGWTGVIDHTLPERLAVLDWGHGLGDGARAPIWGFAVGGLVLYAAYYGVDQSQVQRQLSARSVEQARWALGFNALLRFPLTLLYAALGLAVGAVYVSHPALQTAVPEGRWDQLMPQFVTLFLSDGWRGLVIAAVMAAAMSSLDSALNSLSAATVRDFVVPTSGSVAVARWATLGWGVFILAVAWQTPHWGSSVLETINRVGALFYGPLLSAFMCGILDRRATARAVKVGVAAGLATNLLLWAWLGTALFWMWWNVSGLIAAGLTCWAVSRLPPGQRMPQAIARPPAISSDPQMRRWATMLGVYTLFIAIVLVMLDASRA